MPTKCTQRHVYNYHEYISDDWQDLLDGTDGWELTETFDDGTVVKVAKVGGGTPGSKYAGYWYYKIKIPGKKTIHGDDYVTTREHGHRWVARNVLEHFI